MNPEETINNYRENYSVKEREEALLMCCDQGDLPGVRALLALNTDVNVTGDDGSNPLIAACCNEESQDIVKLLIEKGSPVNSSDQDGFTPLLYAALYGNIASCTLLIHAGADVDHVNSENETALFLVTSRAEDSPDSLRVIPVLLENGANPDIPDEHGDTPLHKASKFGLKDVVKQLIKAGADVNAKGNQGISPLMYAAGGGWNDLVKLLLDSKADIHHKSELDMTSLHFACLSKTAHETALISLVEMLLKAGVDINSIDYRGRSALHNAVVRKRTELVKILLEYGANAEMTDNNNLTALEIAKSNSDKEIVNLLKGI